MYIEVILPVPLADSYTYFVPPEMEAQIVPGVLVWVEFGKNKRYSGVVSYIRQIPPESIIGIKPILAVETEKAVVIRPQIRFWEWISQYYLCKLGEVFAAALPSGLRSDSSVSYTSKKETFVRFASYPPTKAAFQLLNRAAKQEELFLAFIQYSQAAKGEIPKKELLAKSHANINTLNGLIEKCFPEIR